MIKSVLLKRCFSSVKAHFYINELNNRGIYAFLQNEHTTDLIPFGDGGYLIHVNADQYLEADNVIKEMEANETREEDFREATMEDIEYEKLKASREKKKSNQHKITMAILIALAVIVFISYILKGSILF